MDAKFVILVVEYIRVPIFSSIGQCVKRVKIWAGSSGSKKPGGQNGVQNRILHPGEPYIPSFTSIGRFCKNSSCPEDSLHCDCFLNCPHLLLNLSRRLARTSDAGFGHITLRGRRDLSRRVGQICPGGLDKFVQASWTN